MAFLPSSTSHHVHGSPVSSLLADELWTMLRRPAPAMFCLDNCAVLLCMMSACVRMRKRTTAAYPSGSTPAVQAMLMLEQHQACRDFGDQKPQT